MFRTILALLAAAFVLSGCSLAGLELDRETFQDFPKAPNATWLSRHTSLANYRYVEVWPARNLTGEVFDPGVEDLVTRVVSEKLEEYGYSSSYGPDDPDKVLVVRLNLLSYEPGSTFRRMICARSGAGAAQVTLLAELIDKRYDTVIGELVVDDDVRGSTFGLGCPGADKGILEQAATSVAEEINKTLSTL